MECTSLEEMTPPHAVPPGCGMDLGWQHGDLRDPVLAMPKPIVTTVTTHSDRMPTSRLHAIVLSRSIALSCCIYWFCI